MKTDEEIAQDKARTEPVLGPTHTEWYVEACQIEYDDDARVIAWACRCRELARTKARDTAELIDALEKLIASLVLEESDIVSSPIVNGAAREALAVIRRIKPEHESAMGKPVR